MKASLRGEEVVIDRDGKPQVRLTPVSEAQGIDREARWRKLNALLEEMDRIPKNDDAPNDLEWDENGLPI